MNLEKGSRVVRIYADFNDETADGGYWILQTDNAPIEETITEIGLSRGDHVLLYQDEDDFEVEATLQYKYVDAIGLEEAGINDDRDMLQEMRMVLRAHRVPWMADDDVPSLGQVLRMATSGGAATTPFGSHIGTLAVGKAADLVLIDWDKLAYPYLDQETPVF